MDVFLQARSRLNSLRDAIPNIIQKGIDANKERLLDINRDDQLYKKGIKATGEAITPSYAPSTIRIKKLKGQPYNRVTLKDTGKLHRELKLFAYPTYFQISSPIIYSPYLKEKYSANVLGITKESLDLFALEVIKPYIELELKNKLND